jgi:HD-like signal output (HDOD) protein
VLRALALSAHVFGTVEGGGFTQELLDQVQRASYATAWVARKMTRERRAADDAFTAGVVHDVGKIIIALSMPAAMRQIVEDAKTTGRPFHELEHEALGVTHAEVGAYLLGVWGLPLSIVETAAYHHAPSRSGSEPNGVLAAVHLASGVVDEIVSPGNTVLDLAFLERTGHAQDLPAWRAAAHELLDGSPKAKAG